jgi:hypothetical protein
MAAEQIMRCCLLHLLVLCNIINVIVVITSPAGCG